jgi:hypothetical protein
MKPQKVRGSIKSRKRKLNHFERNETPKRLGAQQNHGSKNKIVSEETKPPKG